MNEAEEIKTSAVIEDINIPRDLLVLSGTLRRLINSQRKQVNETLYKTVRKKWSQLNEEIHCLNYDLRTEVE